MGLWLTWLVLGGLFVALGFRRPLLRALRAARAQTEETAYRAPMRPSLSAAPEADLAPDSRRELGRPKSDRRVSGCRPDGCGLEAHDAAVSS